jgi:hypothetical protein
VRTDDDPVEPSRQTDCLSVKGEPQVGHKTNEVCAETRAPSRSVMITTYLDPPSGECSLIFPSIVPAAWDASNDPITNPSLGPGEVRGFPTDGQFDHDTDVDNGDPRHLVRVRPRRAQRPGQEAPGRSVVR